MTKKLLKFTGITIIAVIWAIVVFKFIYPYDYVLSELARQQRFVFLYEQQRLAGAKEVSDDLLKSDNRWQYGLTSDFEVLEVTFPINKKVYFLTTFVTNKTAFEDSTGEKSYALSARSLSTCMNSNACKSIIFTGLGDKGRVYARSFDLVKEDDPNWQATLQYVELLVRANVERQDLLINFIRYGIFALPFLLLGLWLLFRGFVNSHAAKL